MRSYIELGLTPVAASHFTDAEVLDAVLRRMRRRAAIVHAERGRGLPALATIASTAAFAGCLGTCFGIINSFCGGNGEKSALLGILAGFLSEAIVPTALALAVAIFALIFYNILIARLECLRMEMDATALALVNVLSLLTIQKYFAPR